MGKVTLQPGYVLHSRPYRDSSMVVELLTPQQGRVSVVARGARSSGRRRAPLASLLQPFMPLLLSFSGRTELKTLTGAEAAGAAVPLVGQSLYSGLYLNELVVRLLHRDDPHPGVSDAYQQALDELAVQRPADLVLRRFEFALLQELGYGFDLDIDGCSGEPLDSSGRYVFHGEYGLVRMSGPVDHAAQYFSGAQLLAVAAGEHTPAARRTAKLLMRQALASHLGDKPLKSRELFRRQRRAVPKRAPG